MAKTANHKARSQAENGRKKSPVQVIRPGNGISLAIYESTVTSRNGEPRTAYSGTIRKAYRNDEGKWDHVQTLYPSDFLLASWAYAKAHEWVLGQYDSEEEEEC